jgi:hypothetical protein
MLPYVKTVETGTTLTDSSQNTFLNYFSHFTSIYEAISADLLHQIELGVFGKHFWLWVISKGDMPGYLSDGELDMLDDRYSVFVVLWDVDLLSQFQTVAANARRSSLFKWRGKDQVSHCSRT